VKILTYTQENTSSENSRSYH